MLDKTFRPGEVEAKHYSRWEEAGAFAAHVESETAPYCIMMPPPNVTGSLHMGHALTFTIQDVLIRYHRMLGRDTLGLDVRREGAGLFPPAVVLGFDLTCPSWSSASCARRSRIW